MATTNPSQNPAGYTQHELANRAPHPHAYHSCRFCKCWLVEIEHCFHCYHCRWCSISIKAGERICEFNTEPSLYKGSWKGQTHRFAQDWKDGKFVEEETEGMMPFEPNTSRDLGEPEPMRATGVISVCRFPWGPTDEEARRDSERTNEEFERWREESRSGSK